MMPEAFPTEVSSYQKGSTRVLTAKAVSSLKSSCEHVVKPSHQLCASRQRSLGTMSLVSLEQFLVWGAKTEVPAANQTVLHADQSAIQRLNQSQQVHSGLQKGLH